jgi:sugar lactone lactonase YvrE
MKKFILILSFITFSVALVHSQIISTVAGCATPNNVPATSIGMEIFGVVADKHGNLYVTDASNSVIREVNLSIGIATIVAGTGNYGDKGDGGAATAASIGPEEIALDTAGNIYFEDNEGLLGYPYSGRIRKVDIATGGITTVVGTGTLGFSGSGSPATAAEINTQHGGIAFDKQNNLYLADDNNQRIRKVNALTGIITTIAGTGLAGYGGDNGAAISAKLNYPSSVCVDDSGSIYLTDRMNNRVRKINWKTGIITTIAGNGTLGYSGDGGPATAAELASPFGLNLDKTGNVYVADGSNNRLRKINVSTGIISTVAGNGILGFSGDGGSATSAEVNNLTGVSLDTAGNIYVVDGLDVAQSFSIRVRKIDVITNNISTVAGNGGANYNGDGIPATNAQISVPNSIKIDAAGNMYIADYSNYRIREINGAGIISTFCGSGSCGDMENMLAANAEIYGPSDLAFDKSGNMFISDYYNNRISEIDINDSLIPFAGNGFNEPLSGAYSGDGGPATVAELSWPNGVAVDDSNNVIIADFWNNRVRKVNRKTGIISTLAGRGLAGFSGDGGLATSAVLDGPEAVAVDDSGNVFITDSFNQRIRKVNGSTGIITTIAGNGTAGYSGDGGPATAAKLNNPIGIALDKNGYLYISDCLNQRIRVVEPLTHFIQKIHTVAGNGTLGFSGDGGPAASAELNYPQSIATDNLGDLYIADYSNNRIRKVTNVLGSINPITDAEPSAKVYPNPNNGSFQLVINNYQSVIHGTVEIYNMLGEKIYSKSFSTINSLLSIDISSKSAGVYLYRVVTETGSLISEGKIIKE